MREKTFRAYERLCELEKQRAAARIEQARQQVGRAKQVLGEAMQRAERQQEQEREALTQGFDARFLRMLGHERVRLLDELARSQQALELEQQRERDARGSAQESKRMERQCEKLALKMKRARREARARAEEQASDELGTLRAAQLALSA